MLSCMSAENPLVDHEISGKHLVGGIFETKRTIEQSIHTLTRGQFIDHHLRVNGQTISIQALYGNEFRLYLIEPEEAILFEPTPFNNNVLEVISIIRSNASGIDAKTQRYIVVKEGLSTTITSNGKSTPSEEPMQALDFENASTLLGRIQNALEKAISD